VRDRTRDVLVVLAIGAVLAVVVALRHRAPQPAAPPPVLDDLVRITGRIVDAGGRPIKGITVLATTSGTAPGDPDTSDANGRFTTLAPRGEAIIQPFDPSRQLCAHPLAKTIAGPLELGDLAMSPCK
jgi:Carboxypeptidase regulatory-like domain